MQHLVIAMFVLVSSRAHADGSQPWDGTTVVAQSGAAVALSTGGGLVLRHFAFVDCPPNDGWLCTSLRRDVLIGATTVAATIASVQLIGDARDGTGSLAGTAIGGGVGFALGLGGALLVPKLTTREPFALATWVAATAAGAVVGYHLTSDGNDRALRIPLMSGSF